MKTKRSLFIRAKAFLLKYKTFNNYCSARDKIVKGNISYDKVKNFIQYNNLVF